MDAALAGIREETRTVVKLLFDAGADVNAQSRFYDNAL